MSSVPNTRTTFVAFQSQARKFSYMFFLWAATIIISKVIEYNRTLHVNNIKSFCSCVNEKDNNAYLHFKNKLVILTIPPIL